MQNTISQPDFLSHLATLAQSIPGGTTAFTVVLFILVLGLLIFVHEMGHYLAARSVGIRVEAFSIGFGREIFGWNDKHGTRWKIGWMPMGGYVQMHGQEDGKAYSHVEDSDSYSAKSVWQRAWVIVAGPLANLLFGFVLLLAVMLGGEHRLMAQVGQTVPDMPAAAVFQTGDTILAINTEPVADWDAFQKTVQDNLDKPMEVTFDRAGQMQTASLSPKVSQFTDRLGNEHTVGRLGIAPSYATFVVQHPPIEAVSRAAERTWEITSLTVISLYKLLIGAVSADNLTGPLGIANLTGQTASSGLFALTMFMVVITINLCIVNLFPLPVLDGGHLVFLVYEKLRGKPLGMKAQEWAFRFGLACIIGLAGFATFNDVKNFGFIKKDVSDIPVENATVPAASAASIPVAE
ncbi:MAG: RIP metalloprotease RseP [Pseudomonas fluorescens]|nr:MAG: RIP metalloprotease RseP [Pseudomonas fluorescens]